MKTPTILEMLLGARNLIARPDHWTQHVFARGPDGNPRDFESSEAQQFCLAGALYRLYPKVHLDAVEAIVLAGTEFKTIATFNDASCHAVVLAAVDAAIQRLSELSREDEAEVASTDFGPERTRALCVDS